MSKFTFMGKITAVEPVTAPKPFHEVVAGEEWTLAYTFDAALTTDVDGRAEVGQYRNAVTDMELKIGESRVSGPCGTALPGGFSSVIAVNNDDKRVESGFANYTAQVGLPDASAWGQVLLYDKKTTFGDDSLPLDLPKPFKKEFLRRDFILREAGSTRVCLLGTVTSFHS